MTGGAILLAVSLTVVGVAVGYALGQKSRRAVNSAPAADGASAAPVSDTGSDPSPTNGERAGGQAAGWVAEVERPAASVGADAVEPLTTDAFLGVLDRYPIGLFVADATGAITFRNAAARSYDGTHVAALLNAAVDRRFAEVLALQPTDHRRQSDAGELIEFYGPPRQVMSVATERLADGSAVAFVEDVTESDRLDRVRTDFVANVSHELKTPVGALTLLAEALADETDEAVRNRLIKRMEIEAERAGKTIDHLVELSEIESNPTREPSQVVVSDLIAASIDRVLELARHRSVTVDVDVDVALGRRAVTGDRVQLESALGNLVENAVAYSPPTSSVTISAVADPPARDDGAEPAVAVGAEAAVAAGAERVKLSVIDRGVGIPKGQQDRIFERFYRVDRARSRETGGTGLGLSIVKRAAVAHGGSVSVTSVEGEGSTFVLELPLAPQTKEGGGVQ